MIGCVQDNSTKTRQKYPLVCAVDNKQSEHNLFLSLWTEKRYLPNAYGYCNLSQTYVLFITLSFH